jgi:peptidyl-Asp metalloendopeptidase
LVPGRGIPLDAAADSIIAVRSGNTVMANIRIGDALYRLTPVEKGAHALVEVDQSKFLPDEDAAAYAQMQRNAVPGDVFGGPSATPKAISTIRVMVAFGASATASIGNEQQALDLAFTEANQALANTNTDIRFAQAGSIRFYTQSETSTYSTMLSRLTNMSDGFYDAIGGQRDSSTADIVAYVAPQSSTLCGQAAGIATSNANAYFVISWSCLSGNWTFVHEAAHVVGARHDNDSTTSPFPYGHGYVMSSINRRTVMAVNNGPCSSCTRFPAFSSPNYTLSGVTIGTASFNDNTRVWRTRGPTVAAFR